MKNTEYKDVFDFGEEALSMGNNFSIDENIQIQNTLGETIRGMKRISPILQTKPVSVDSQFIQKYYFIDATKKNNEKEILIDEIKFMKRDGYSFAMEEFFEDSNKNGILGDAGDLLDFKLLIFSTDDGNKIREAHDVVQAKSDEIILFLESDSDLLTGKARLSAKIGSGIRKKFFDKDGKVLNNSLTEKIQTKRNDIETKTLIELLEKGSVKGNIISIEGFMNLFKDQLLSMFILNYILGEIVDSVAEKIDFLKISDSFWDSDHPEYFFDKDNLIENIKISDEQIIKLENIFLGTGIIFAGPFAPMVPITMKVLAPKLRPIAKQWINSFNQHITNVIQEVFAKIETDPLSNFLWKEAQKQIAFECGAWNGIVDFISSLFKFIALVLKAPTSIVEDPALTLETLDNIFDFLTSGEVFSTLRSEFASFFKDLINDLKEQDSDDINWTKVFYIIGFGVIFVASFFIPYANIAKVLGSLGKIGEIFTVFVKAFEESLKIASVATGAAFGKLTTPLAKVGKKAISEFLAIFKSGSRLRKFLSSLKTKIVEWIKKNYQLFFSAYDKALLEGWRLLSKFFKTETVINATNGVKIPCFIFNKGLVPVDKILMYARGRVRGAENLIGLEKEFAKLKNLKQTARKTFDESSENVKRIEKLKKDIDNIKKSLNNKVGLEKAGFVDDLHGNKKVFDYVLAIANKNASKIKQGEWFIAVIKGPKGKITTMTQWQKLENGKLYLKTIKIF